MTNRPAPTFALGDTVAMANETKRTGMVMGHRWNEQLDEWTVTVAWDGYRPRGPEWDEGLGMAVHWHLVTRNGRPAVSVHCETSLVPSASTPGQGILAGTLRALDSAVQSSLAMIAADRATIAAFNAHFPFGADGAREAYNDAAAAADVAREHFIDACTALCRAIDAVPPRDCHGRFVRDQAIAVGELLHAIASDGDDDTRRAVSFIRFRWRRRYAPRPSYIRSRAR